MYPIDIKLASQLPRFKGQKLTQPVYRFDCSRPNPLGNPFYGKTRMKAYREWLLILAAEEFPRDADDIEATEWAIHTLGNIAARQQCKRVSMWIHGSCKLFVPDPNDTYRELQRVNAASHKGIIYFPWESRDVQQYENGEKAVGLCRIDAPHIRREEEPIILEVASTLDLDFGVLAG
ncbi:hypothetical protein [Lyngbya sp. CCY1209]|uniref:hypothetical protein n=1 Tax=Lyngbya sp. CCY1209 TaxID=2886103 RepID=UPI002D211AF0|nr:hypothetical protein [Lyngbya sp. CCY1209]MEB3884030.1 hypothetical protein [Lyngbya sp. CCY1209]